MHAYEDFAGCRCGTWHPARIQHLGAAEAVRRRGQRHHVRMGPGHARHRRRNPVRHRAVPLPGGRTPGRQTVPPRLLTIPLDLCGRLVGHPSVFAVSPLLREAVLVLTDDHPETRPGAHRRLLAVVVDELSDTPAQSLHLPEPDDDRLRTVTDLLHADPARPATLIELGRAAGASERTLSRLFHAELGMSFHQWRTILRIHHALAHLTNGMSVTDTATTCGWSNPPGFIDAFNTN
ncbi:helix-turn-helix domain-containing protein [Embleya sp. NPDC055664]